MAHMRLFASRCWCLAVVLVPATGHAEDVLVSISYSEIHDRIFPFAGKTTTEARVEARLTGGGTVEHSETRASGAARGAGLAALKLGTAAQRGWRVAGSSSIDAPFS
jgi:hypothetical protein